MELRGEDVSSRAEMGGLRIEAPKEGMAGGFGAGERWAYCGEA